MKYHYRLFALLLLLVPFLSWAQRPTNLTGWLVYSRTGNPYGSIWGTDLQGHNLKLVDSAQLPRVSADGKFLFYTRQDGNINTNQTGWVARMEMATGRKADLFRFDDWTVGYDMLLSDSAVITGYSCSINLINFAGAPISVPVSGDCFDDAPVFRQRDSAIVYHNLHAGIKLTTLGRHAPGNSVVPNTLPGDYWPQWSPDGNWILFGRPGITNVNDQYRYINNLYKIHPDGSDLTRLTRFAATDTSRFGQNFAWSQDGSQVYACGVFGRGQPYSIIAIKADSSGEMQSVLTVPNATISWLHGSPGNHTFTATAPKLAQRPLSLYPNPARNEVKVQLPNPEKGSVRIRALDATGKAVLEQSMPGTGVTLSIGRLGTGVYRVEALTEKAIYGSRLVIE